MAKTGLFKPPKHKWLAEIISFETPSKARKSAKRLLNALRRGRIHGRRIGRRTALTILKALVYAANRAKASAKRRNLSRKEKHELLQVAKIYRKAALKARKIYHEKYAET
jgi:hypothetical protein